MSKTVIKQGTDPNHEYLSICPNCGTIFKYEYSDMEEPIQAWHEYHITCPTCGYMLAFNNLYLKEIDYTVYGAGLVQFKESILIPSGCTVYVVYNNGGIISLLDISQMEITPTKAPLLIVGNCSKITIAPGVEVLNPREDLVYAKFHKFEVNEDRSPYYRINELLEIVPFEDSDVDENGLLSTAININSEISIVE